MRAKLVLAKNFREGNDFARDMGWSSREYRIVRKAGAIRGIRSAEVFVLPGFLTRLDRHAILHALQWARTLDVFYVDPADLRDDGPAGAEPDAPADPVTEIADALDDHSAPADFENPEVWAALADGVEEPEPEPKPKKRVRRKRCEVCEDLIMPDEYDEHLAAHKHLGG